MFVAIAPCINYMQHGGGCVLLLRVLSVKETQRQHRGGCTV